MNSQTTARSERYENSMADGWTPRVTREGNCAKCSIVITQNMGPRNEALYFKVGGDLPTRNDCWQPKECDKCITQAKAREAEAVAVRATADRERFLNDVDAAFESALELSGVPARLRRNLESFEPSGDSLAARRAVDALLAGKCSCVLLLGSVGCGKSTEAGRAILRRIEIDREQTLARGSDTSASSPWGRIVTIPKTYRFTTLANLTLRVADTYRRDTEVSTLEVLREYVNAPLLVLDDVGAERPTPHTVATLQQVIDRRYNDEAQTVVTSNLESLADLGAHLCSLTEDTVAARRVVDRLAEMAVIVKINSGSHRTERGRALRSQFNTEGALA